MRLLAHADAEQTIELAAAPEVVWDLVSDITRTPDWSPVVQRSEWIGEHAAPVQDARFRGHNRFRGARWTRECVVTAAERPALFAFSTLAAGGEEQTRWRYRIEPADGGGTQLSLAFESVTIPPWVRFLQRLPGGKRTSDQQAGRNLAESLHRIADLVTTSS